ncbi:TPA: hypothetical protein QFT21_005874 [Bacillus paranthracis]|nr:hypothetical protein [Bacillus paranthracis]
MMRMESLRRLSLWMRNRSTRSKLSIVKNRKKSLQKRSYVRYINLSRMALTNRLFPIQVKDQKTLMRLLYLKLLTANQSVNRIAQIA